MSDGVNFDRKSAKRVGRVVRHVEAGGPGRARPAGYAYGDGDFVAENLKLVELQGNLRAAGDETAGTKYVLALEVRPAEPDDDEDDTLVTETDEEQAIKVWPWQIGDNQQIPTGWQCWIVLWRGRWFPLVPQDCLQYYAPEPEE